MVSDRGQLLLVGAIVLGTVIVGVVFTLNSLQYTDAVARDDGARPVQHAERVEATVEHDLGRLVREVEASDPANLQRALERNVTTYANQARNMSLTGEGAYLDVSLNVSATEGTRATSASTHPFNAYVSPETVSTDTSDIERFTLDFASVDSGRSFVVSADNGTDQWRLRVTNDAGDPEYEIETWLPGDGRFSSPGPACRHVSPAATVDLVEGTAGTCSFVGIGALEPDFDVRFDQGHSNHARGTFEYRFVGTDRTTGSAASSSYPVVPAIDYRYRGSEISYNRTIRLEGSP
ncbi:MAG: hypothetical protein ABEJ89_00770 [Haloarculaceae archaeon]